MAVKIRLQRRGARHAAVYRLVAADSRSPRDGRFIEILGTYAPRAKRPAKRARACQLEAAANIPFSRAINGVTREPSLR